MRELQFKNNVDEVRVINKKAYEMKTQIEREIQQVEKHRGMERDYEREMLYAQINEEDRLERERLEVIKREEYLVKIQERNEALKE